MSFPSLTMRRGLQARCPSFSASPLPRDEKRRPFFPSASYSISKNVSLRGLYGGEYEADGKNGLRFSSRGSGDADFNAADEQLHFVYPPLPRDEKRRPFFPSASYSISKNVSLRGLYGGALFEIEYEADGKNGLRFSSRGSGDADFNAADEQLH
jgi:hypothetical protein